MHEKTIACVALSYHDYPSLDAKLDEATRWLDLAATAGADLVVFPEFLNKWTGDGEGSPQLPIEDIILTDWQTSMAKLLDAAAAQQVAVVVPVLAEEAGQRVNAAYLVDAQGNLAGAYRKLRLTPIEVERGLTVGEPAPFEWEGLRVGGAICFDCFYPEVFQAQADLGVDLFIVPSLTPAGDYLPFYALHHSAVVAQAYPAWSRVIDMDGQTLAATGQRNETLRFGFGSPIAMSTVNFNKEAFHGDFNQAHMVDVQRKYGKRVAVHYDQPNTLWVVESRCVDLPIAQVIEDFGLIPRRAYYQQCAKSEQRGRQFLSGRRGSL